ncbi:MAG: hypothetical protein JO100_08495 [Pseudonocardia sp.]|nr:hypothetical protein [Pseudonocardia sp.]
MDPVAATEDIGPGLTSLSTPLARRAGARVTRCPDECTDERKRERAWRA